jgi:hypothetical protein
LTEQNQKTDKKQLPYQGTEKATLDNFIDVTDLSGK